jgi:hypothetical protein
MWVWQSITGLEGLAVPKNLLVLPRMRPRLDPGITAFLIILSCCDCDLNLRKTLHFTSRHFNDTWLSSRLTFLHTQKRCHFTAQLYSRGDYASSLCATTQRFVFEFLNFFQPHISNLLLVQSWQAKWQKLPQPQYLLPLLSCCPSRKRICRSTN